MKIVAFGQFLSVSAADKNHAASSFDVVYVKIITTIVSSIQIRQRDLVFFDNGANPVNTIKIMKIVAFG